jgi:hypothetical protein
MKKQKVKQINIPYHKNQKRKKQKQSYDVSQNMRKIMQEIPKSNKQTMHIYYLRHKYEEEF